MTDVLNRLKSALSDGYAIEREIGRGGMATVYLAEDLKHHRKVAVKVLRPELGASIGVERFLREIEITANLNHPHILPLLDSGAADGFLFYVMPYVEGESLRDRLSRERQLPIDEAVKIAGEVADALGFAHQRNVIHRDIKPENILLEAGHAVVADLGIARAIGEAREDRLTETGLAVGTPAYMSPEQASGESELDGRSDLYSLGCVLFEMLAGEPPFTGPSAEHVIRKHMSVEAPPVSVVRPTVPERLSEAVARALAKAPVDRYQSAAELGAVVGAAQLGVATPRGGTVPVRAAVDRQARRRWMMAGGGVGAAAVIAVIAVMAAGPRGSRAGLDPNNVVVAPFRNATGDPTLDLVGERLGHWITQGVQRAEIVSTPWDGALQAWEWVEGEVEAGRVQDPILALAERTGAGVVVSGTVYPLGSDSLEVQANVTDVRRGRPLGTLEPIRGSRLSDRELLTEVQQRVAGLLAIRFDEISSATADAIGRPPKYEAYKEFCEVRAFDLTGDPRSAEAIEYMRRAAELDSTWAQPLITMAIVLMNEGRPGEADSVLTVLEGFGDRLTPYERAAVRGRRARWAGDRAEWYRSIRRAAELAPNSGDAWNAALCALRIANRPGEAVEILSRVSPESYLPRESPRYWTMLAWAYLRLGEYERAIETVESWRQQHPDNDGFGLVERAAAYAAMGRAEELGALLDEIEVSQPNAMSGRLVYAIETLRAHGHHELAGHMLDRAFQWFDSRPPDEAEIWGFRHNYGTLLVLAGRIDEARGLFAELAQEFDNEDSHGGHGWLAATLGDTMRALAEIDWLERHPPPQASFSNGASTWRVVIYGALGDNERVTQLLSDAENWWEFSWIPTDVMVWFDPIRDHPAFRELIRPKG